jgi:integrase
MTYYDLNEVILNKKKIYRYLGEEEKPIENRGYTREEIAKMLEVCDERVKALILLLASTGVRIRAIVDLKLEDLTSIPNHDIYRVKVYSDSKQSYPVFITPEASKAINTYLGYRERYGEKLIPKSPLFRDQFDRNDPDSIQGIAFDSALKVIEGIAADDEEKPARIRTLQETYKKEDLDGLSGYAGLLLILINQTNEPSKNDEEENKDKKTNYI